MAFGQDQSETIHHLHHPTQIAIENALLKGEIALDEAMLQQFYAGYRPHSLAEKFQDPDAPPIKCMVPVQRTFLEKKNELSASTVLEIEQMTASSTTEFEYITPSGIFVLQYDTTGTDGVPPESTLPEAISEGIPDYIYLAAFAADSSYRYMVDQSGFTDFRRDNPYEISFRNFGFFGTTTSSGSTTTIQVHSNFEGFPPNTHPLGNQIGALYVTLAHEIKHAIQFTANRWRGSAGSFDWIEMDATLMEEVVFDDVNDYYNVIKTSLDSNSPHSLSIFGRPTSATPGAYWHVSWMIYFHELYGTEFFVDVWEIISVEPLINFAEAMDQVLQTKNLTLAKEHIKNHLWHMGSGDEFSLSDSGFSERLHYPNPNFQHQLFSVTDSLRAVRVSPFAANYINILSPVLGEGQPRIELEATNTGVGINAIGYFTDGSTQETFFINPQETYQELQLTWNWSELNMLSIGVINTNRTLSSDYELNLITALPDDDFIAQNYPNPFNGSTRIEFTLDARKNVKVEIYDSIGRKISTLLNDTIDRGFHSVNFVGAGLSSGVYFYRITTDQTSITRKMVLVK